MKLGNYVEIATPVEDLRGALAFYMRLNFKPVADAVVTDGSINIRLVTNDSDTSGEPVLNYYGSNLQAVRALGVTLVENEGRFMFNSPAGLRIRLNPNPSGIPMPSGSPMTRKPISRCGKFGEFSLHTDDAKLSTLFWSRLGFMKLYGSDRPYPFSIVSDGLTVIGVHQADYFSEPHITYFSEDMPDRIAAFKRNGIEMAPVSPEIKGRVVNARFMAPGGQRFFMFIGEV